MEFSQSLNHFCDFFLFLLPTLCYFKRILSPDLYGILKFLFQQCHTWEENIVISSFTVLLITRLNESSCHSILTLEKENLSTVTLKSFQESQAASTKIPFDRETLHFLFHFGCACINMQCNTLGKNK